MRCKLGQDSSRDPVGAGQLLYGFEGRRIRGAPLADRPLPRRGDPRDRRGRVRSTRRTAAPCSERFCERSRTRERGNHNRQTKSPDWATTTYGETFPEKSLPKLVLRDLEVAGYITAEKTTGGRGAKPFLVTPTPKLIVEVVDPLLEQLGRQADPKLVRLLRRPLTEILAEPG